MFFRYPVSHDMQDWIADGFAWAIRHELLTAKTPLVLADRAHFTAPPYRDGQDGDRVVAALIADLQRHLGMPATSVEVMALDMLPAEYRYDPNALSGVAGTWQDGEGHALIRYDPALLHQPLPLLSVLSHELMHHRLHMIPELPPGGTEAEELSTDLHVITCGLGLLQMAGAEAAGWQGYMGQPSRAHALALFLHVTGHDAQKALSALPPAARGYLRKALKYIGKTPAALDSIPPLPA